MWLQSSWDHQNYFCKVSMQNFSLTRLMLLTGDSPQFHYYTLQPWEFGLLFALHLAIYSRWPHSTLATHMCIWYSCFCSSIKLLNQLLVRLFKVLWPCKLMLTCWETFKMRAMVMNSLRGLLLKTPFNLIQVEMNMERNIWLRTGRWGWLCFNRMKTAVIKITLMPSSGENIFQGSNSDKLLLGLTRTESEQKSIKEEEEMVSD